MNDATEIGNAVAAAIAEDRQLNDPAARREAQNRTMNERIRERANVGKFAVGEDGELVPLTGQGLDQGSRGAAPVAPDTHQTMNDWLRGRGGEDE